MIYNLKFSVTFGRALPSAVSVINFIFPWRPATKIDQIKRHLESWMGG